MSDLSNFLLHIDKIESDNIHPKINGICKEFIKRYNHGEDISSSFVQNKVFDKFNINPALLTNKEISYIKTTVEENINEF